MKSKEIEDYIIRTCKGNGISYKRDMRDKHSSTFIFNNGDRDTILVIDGNRLLINAYPYSLTKLYAENINSVSLSTDKFTKDIDFQIVLLDLNIIRIYIGKLR